MPRPASRTGASARFSNDGAAASESRYSRTPAARIRRCNHAPAAAGAFILYWMIGARRTRWNFGLQRAAELSLGHGLPLLVLEPLRAGYPWASDRLHRFVIDGMVDNKARFAERGVAYYPYVEPRDGAGKGLVEALADHAAVVVTDDFPAFFLPRMVNAAAHRISVRVEAIDGNGLLPMRASDGPFATAYAFRRFLQRELPAHLERLPHPDPLDILPPSSEARVPTDILDRWPPADLSDPADLIARVSIDHSVPPVDLRGGSEAAAARLSAFFEGAFDRYATDANHPERNATSRLSPYLHFGHVSPHEVFDRTAAHEGWNSARLSRDTRGSRAGWWGMSESAESFLDQLVTWRELGFIRCLHVARYDAYEALPDWARKTLAEHASDPREAVYGLADFEDARTFDPLWNAAQNQLRREGRIHNYLRMLWGKKILEWSESPREAGPERPVFGKIRYMSSANTARKYRVRGYIEKYTSA
ncbi:MAG: hypothetical protein OXN97_25470 [Bryobacterales bacterium]|nr:hypothetical protein [Bryobacterales bacterium]